MSAMKSKPAVTRRDIVPLSDLVPRQDVKGGAGKRVFGATAPPLPAPGSRGDKRGVPATRKPPR